MTGQEKLVTVREGVTQDEARSLFHQHRLEKLIVVDNEFRCVGLVTVKDMEKATCIRTPARTRRAGCASPPPHRRRQGL